MKVVKTLYEASTFTQLGRTVGSALRNPAGGDVSRGIGGVNNGETDYEDETIGMTSGTTMENTKMAAGKKHASSLFDALTSCTSPEGQTSDGRAKAGTLPQPRNGAGNQSVANTRRNDMSTIDTRETRPSQQNFLEQVMNCTLGQNDEDSDEDTYNPRNEYSYDAETTTTFESLTDDGYDSAQGRRRQRRGRH